MLVLNLNPTMLIHQSSGGRYKFIILLEPFSWAARAPKPQFLLEMPLFIQLDTIWSAKLRFLSWLVPNEENPHVTVFLKNFHIFAQNFGCSSLSNAISTSHKTSRNVLQCDNNFVSRNRKNGWKYSVKLWAVLTPWGGTLAPQGVKKRTDKSIWWHVTGAREDLVEKWIGWTKTRSTWGQRVWTGTYRWPSCYWMR